MEDKKKKGKGSIITIIILIITIICLIGYILVDKDIIKLGNKEENKTVEKSNVQKEKDIELDDSRFYAIYKQLESYTYDKNRSDGHKSFSDQELGLIAIGISDLKESDFTNTGEVTEWGDSYYTFSGSKLINYLQKYFGSKVTLNKNSLVGQTITLANVNFNGSGMQIENYDSNTDTFKVRFGGVGGTSGPSAKLETRKIVSAKLTQDTITVEEKAIYTDITADNAYANINYKIYSNPSKINKIDEKTFNVDNIANESILVDSYLDKATTITHIFKLDEETNNWYFSSSNIKG